MAGDWVVSRTDRDADFRLFCLPYAGGGSTLFRSWPAQLEFDVLAVELPGRGRRFAEPCAVQMDEIVEPLLKAMAPYLDRPFGFYGHSLGAMISFELSHACRRELGLEPELLITAASVPPRREPKRDRSGPDDDAIKQRLRLAGGTPPEALENKELMALLMPTLKGDFALIDGYYSRQTSKLSCRLTAIAGADDPLFPPSTVNAWAAETSGEFRRFVLPGGHFFMRESESALLSLLAALVDQQQASVLV